MKREAIGANEIAQIFDMSSKFALFAGLRPEQMHIIITQSEILRVTKGDYLFRRGDSPKEIYIILGGRIGFYLEDMTIKEFSTGFSFSESALIGIQFQVVDAKALEDSKLLIISKRKLMQLFEDDSVVFGIFILNIARELARRLAVAGGLLLHKHEIRKE
jgi:CRP/FNR family cyclic AMP-dependent transcriptional regulator